MPWPNWVLDVTLAEPGAPLCFIPLEGDPHGEHSFVVGMNFLSSDPPPECEKLIGVIHMDGQEACDAWCAANPDEMHRLFGARLSAAKDHDH